MTIKRATKELIAAAVICTTTVTLAGAADLDAVSDDDLLERIERLEKIIGPGDKFAVRSGTNKVRVTLNGQINQQARYANDGFDSGVNFVDNDSTSTRFRILGDAALNEKFSVGTAFEFDIESNLSAVQSLQNLDQGSESAAAVGNDFDIRRAEIIFKHKDLGSLFLGQGLTASDGTSEKDLSGTGVSQDFDSDDGSLAFRAQANGALVTTIGAAFNAFDGLSRNNRVRYDTPTFAGLRAGISVDGRGDFDVGLHFAKKDIAGFDVAAGFAYANSGRVNNRTAAVALAQNVGVTQVVNGSISALHRATGLNLTFAAGSRLTSQNLTNVGGVFVQSNPVDNFFFVQGGWKTKLTDLGKTAFAVGYHRSRNVTNSFAGLNTAIRGQFISAKAVQNIDKISTELFLRYTYHTATFAVNGVNTPLRDIHVVAAGARVKF